MPAILISRAVDVLSAVNVDDNATRTRLLIYVLIGFAVIIGLAVWGWTARRRRQSAIPAIATVPADIGELAGEFDGFYVSTTVDGQPLNRIAVRGLGFRSRATIAVADAGVIVALPGNDVFVPREDIREVTTANYTIDRVVEPGGLVLLAWTLGHGSAAETRVDTYLRVDDPQKLIDAISAIVPTSRGKAA